MAKKDYHPAHYYRWKAIKYRCYRENHKSYKYYGGRGIILCAEWHEFKTFQEWCLQTFEVGKTLDRIDNDGPYSPGNCRWASNSEQRKNSRITPLVLLRTKAMRKKSEETLRHKYGDPKTRSFKACATCKNSKSLSDFVKCKDKPDGHMSMCLSCNRARVRTMRQTKNRLLVL